MTFDDEVWRVTKMIPCGRVSTYAAIAKELGIKAYRAVGGALSRNPAPVVVPCHRIVRSDGGIGGFCGSKRLIEKKRRLLESEGIEFYKKKGGYYVKEFRKRLYFP